tara:strand:- start:3294 stop:3530 length:237 start_codon:yes stop_codon:yes gene_type:complete
MDNKDVDIIIRQTNYNRDEAIEKLKIHNGNVMNVIREYIKGSTSSGKDEKVINAKNLNQEIYSQIRKNLPIHNLEPPN